MKNRILQSLTRITSSGRFIPEIDGLRFIAIGLVLLVHIHDYISFRTGFPLDAHHDLVGQGFNPAFYIIARGGIGVQLFFVISGFILGLPFASSAILGRPRVDLFRYLMRRLTRLEPPYMLALLGSIAVTAIFSRNAREQPGFFASCAASVAYLNNLIFSQAPKANIAFWSLEVEIQFYLLVPLLAKIFELRSRSGRRAIICVSILAVAFLQQFALSGGRVPLSIAGQLQYFLGGFLLADVYVADWRESPQPWRWGSWVTVVCWPLFFVLLDERWSLIKPFALPLLIPLMYAAILRRSAGTRWLSSPLITVIGGMCYSLYLLHLPIIYAVGRFSQKLGAFGNYGLTFTLHAIVFLLVILAVSILFFVLIERPCMDREWPTKFIGWIRSFRASNTAELGREQVA